MLVASLTRGVKAGLVAGLVFALFVALVANPLVVYADGLAHGEGAHSHGDGAHGGGDLISMVISDAVSIVSAGLWAILLGGVVFGVAFYFLEPALPGAGATKSYVLGAAGFVAVSGAPWLVLPPVTPGAEQALGTSTRLLWYGGMMVAGTLTCLLAGTAYNRLTRTHGRLVGVAGALAAFGLLAVPALLAPANSVHGTLPATLSTGLTGLVVFGQLLVWASLAAAHARFASPTERRSDRATASTGSVVGAD